MKQIIYTSVLADRFHDYVTFRRSVGYELKTQVYTLRKFDKLLQLEMETPGPVTRMMVEKFLERLSGLQPLTRRMQLSVVRQFLRYLQQFEPNTYIPGRQTEPACSAPRTPYIYTDEEIQKLLTAALRYPERYAVRRWVLYHTLIAFLYATGMRISEALSLDLRDLDWKRGVVRIRRTKFHKTRLVPLTSSTCKGLKRYLHVRAERGHPTTPESPLFVKTDKPGRLSYSTARNAFRSIARMAGLPHSCGRYPRIHDLRHTAATMRLYRWYQEGKDVQSLLPILVTYLGHSAVYCTEIYLTTTAELLEEASLRYERTFDLDIEGELGEPQP